MRPQTAAVMMKRKTTPGPPSYAAAPTVLKIPCLLYTSDAADERSSVDLGGRRIIKKKINLDAQRDTEEHTNTVEVHDVDSHITTNYINKEDDI